MSKTDRETLQMRALSKGETYARLARDIGVMSAEVAAAHPLTKQEIRVMDDELTLLPPRDEVILRARYGLDDGRLATLEAVSKKFGVTDQRVSDIEKRALEKLRQQIHTDRLKYRLGLMSPDEKQAYEGGKSTSTTKTK